MKIEFVIATVNTNRYFCGFEKKGGEPKIRHINFPGEREVYEEYFAAEKEIERIFDRYTGEEELRLQIEKHYVKETEY